MVQKVNSNFCLIENIETKRGWIFALGILQVLLGTLAITMVGVTSLMSVIFLGALFLIGGIAELVFVSPVESSIWLIGLLVGIQLISRGVAWLTIAWTVKGLREKLTPSRVA